MYRKNLVEVYIYENVDDIELLKEMKQNPKLDLEKAIKNKHVSKVAELVLEIMKNAKDWQEFEKMINKLPKKVTFDLKMTLEKILKVKK